MVAPEAEDDPQAARVAPASTMHTSAASRPSLEILMCPSPFRCCDPSTLYQGCLRRKIREAEVLMSRRPGST